MMGWTDQNYPSHLRGYDAGQRKIALGKLDQHSILRRAVEAQDVFPELNLIINEMRAVTLQGGGDEQELGRLICAIIAQAAKALLKPVAGSK
jgi:hypothetical protein